MTFSFHGGPFDGQSLVVDMVETTRGPVAPEEVRLLVVKTKFGALMKVVPSDQFDESEAAYGEVEVYRFDGEGYVWEGRLASPPRCP